MATPQSPSDTIFVYAEPGSTAPMSKLGGLTVLERKLCEAERAGIKRAIVAVEGNLPRRPWALRVEQVVAGTNPPAGATLVRADEIAGMRLESPEARREAEWKLIKSLPKSFQGPIDALINQHVSLRITRLLCKTPVTPNQVTMAALVVGCTAAYLLFAGGATNLVLAGVLIFFQSILDSCDGELARLRFQFSRLGQWLDNIADDITDSILMVALGAATGSELWWFLGLAAGGARVFTQVALYWQVTRLGGDFYDFRWWFESDAETIDDVYDPKSAMTWIRALGRRDGYLFAWSVLCIANVPVVAAAYGVAISAAYVVATLIHIAVTSRAN